MRASERHTSLNAQEIRSESDRPRKAGLLVARRLRAENEPLRQTRSPADVTPSQKREALLLRVAI